MIQQTQVQLNVEFIDKQKLVLRAPFNEQLNAWIRTFPNARFSKVLNAWTCSATPYVANKLWKEQPDFISVSAGSELLDLCLEFCARQEWKAEKKDDQWQPIKRECDSWAHQTSAYLYKGKRAAALFAMEMGTGKSKPTVDLCVNNDYRQMLVLCPTSVRGVWRREFEKWAPNHFELLVLDKSSWGTKRQADEADKFLRMCKARNVPAVVIQNYESASYSQKNKMPFGDWAVSQKWDLICCDESHRIGKPNTNISKLCAKLHFSAKNRLCLTGTPLSHSPLDIFGQFRFLDPGVFGTSWALFRSRYAVSGHFGRDHVVAYQNEDELSTLMNLMTYHVKADDVLELPEVTHQKVRTTLSSKSLRVYQQLEKEMIASVGDGVITVDNAMVKMLRLQQITSGYLPVLNKKEEVVLEKLGDEKQKVLGDILVDVPKDEPVVVFCRFNEDLRRIEEIAKKTGRRYGEISGSRKDLTPHATMPDDVDLMGVQLQAGGVGIDLTRARIGVYYSIGYSLSDYLQSVARMHRPGQERPVSYYHITVKGTADEAVYAAIERRRDIVDAVLDYLREL